jgi:hypothetical protein
MNPGPPIEFSTSYDLTTKLISAVICATLLLPLALTRNVWAAALVMLVLILAFAYSPRGYVLSGRTLTIKRIMRNVEVPLNGLREAWTADREDFRGCLRLWGNGGLFGYYGLFRTSRLGESTWYLTNRSKAVVIITDEKTVLVSPDDTEVFLGAIRSEFPNLDFSGAGAEGRTSSSRPRSRMLVAVVPTAVVAGLAITAFVIFFKPALPAYTITRTDLTIHERFYPITVRADQIDLDQVRMVDVRQDQDWRPTRRTNGFATFHYHSGWFRAGNGKRIWMCRADGTRLVLLPPKDGGTAVLFEARDPERFIQQVQRQWR